MMASDRYIHEMLSLPTFEERLAYLRINSIVGLDKFGFDRYFNQQFYHSKEWRRIRNIVISRDNGCDLGIPDRPIVGSIYIHHINPIQMSDLVNSSDILLNPDFLVCCSFSTHQAIHYGRDAPGVPIVAERTINDTCPWKN